MGYVDVLEEEEVSVTGSLGLKDTVLLPWNIIIAVLVTVLHYGFLDSASCEFLNC